MITPEQYKAKIATTIAKLEAERGKEAIRLASDLTALTKRRVINQGQHDEGGLFSNYSNAVVPAHFYYGRSRASDAKLKRHISSGGDYMISYKEFRDINDLQTGHKDFSFTGRMWQSIKPSTARTAAGKAQVDVTATTDENLNKLSWLSEQEGRSILKVSRKEQQIANRGNQQRITKAIKSVLDAK